MDAQLSLQDIANIVTFVAPGYFAIQTYALIYAKREKPFSRLLVESIIFSLPIVTAATWLRETVFNKPPVENLNTSYVLLLLIIALGLGLLAAILRVSWPIKNISRRLGFSLPDEDFIRAQFSRLKYTTDPVTVKLKSGSVFSGTPHQGSIYSRDSTKQYYFNNLAWYDEATDAWDEREGGVIIDLKEVEYIETPKLREDSGLNLRGL